MSYTEIKGRWPQVLAIAAVLVGLAVWAALTAWPVGAQDALIINYAENGKDEVATFTATDPEGVTPITWSMAPNASIEGVETADIADNTSFTIGDMDGMLKFNSPPDFENPKGSALDDATSHAMQNTYKVVVLATDAEDNSGYHKVTVKVTNVAETGEVTWTVTPTGGSATNLVQFQVGAALAASATDGDIPGTSKAVTTNDARWQWYRSPSKTAMGTAIDGATGTGASYTVTTDDIGMYLRVEAFYNVGTGREESASLTSDYPVLASRSNNDAPEFSPATVTTNVSEGKKGRTVGAPVRATDDISNALNYTLAGGDAARFEIDQKTGQIKTLVDLDREGTDPATATTLGSCADASADPDPKCTVTVIATDSAGEASDPVATVTITITNVDEEPEFSTEGTAIGMKRISRDEGMTALAADEVANVTYMATDPDGLQVNLTLMGADAAKFKLTSSANGGVLSFREKPDYENPTDRDRDNVYEVTVRASDGTMHTDHMVMVTVTDADEPPTVMGKDSVNYAENGKDEVATFTATDPEGVTPITWSMAPNASIEGVETADIADNTSFTIGDMDGMLKFNSPPDFENPKGSPLDDATSHAMQNTYKVVVLATDAEDNSGYHKVTVKVTNVAETGEVTWTVTPTGGSATNLVQFQVGAALAASATDGDIPGAIKDVANNITWRWYRGSSLISGETDASYTVTTEDVSKRLRVTVAYTVGTGREESASLTSDYPVLPSRSSNDAPEFSPATVTRNVSEGKKGMTVGAPVRATDDISNALNYTLAGGDAARFEIDQKTGQIKTLVDLDREGTDPATATTLGSCADASADPDPKCTVTVIATDSAGEASDPVATVTITITNVDEEPEFSTEGTAIGMKRISRDEGMTALAADEVANVTYMATDPDGLQVNLTLMGADAAKFKLTSSANGGVLSFREKPDYENPTDRDRDNVYEVTVRASDGTMHTDHMVMVTVGDADEPPEITASGLRISGPASKSYAENGRDAVDTYTAEGENGANARWTLVGDDAGDFALTSRSGASTMLRFRSSPNYEDAKDADTDNDYEVTVKATAGTDMDTQKVRVTVTDVNELGMLAGKTSPNYEENGRDAVATYTTDGPGSTRWSLDGDDAGDFALSRTSGASTMLRFRTSPNYEAPADADTNNVYKVTVKAAAGGEMQPMHVTVTVDNVEEAGTVTLSSMAPVVGTPVTAVLSDPDNGVTGRTWQWTKSATMAGTYAAISGVTTANYTPVEADVGMYLMVKVMYTDGHGSGKSAESTPVMVSMANTAPTFSLEREIRSVAENTAAGQNIGDPITATDGDGDTLTYTLGGADMADFDIDSATGQLMTKSPLDFETKATYTVTVTADDGNGGHVVVTVTITVTDVDDTGTTLLERYDEDNSGRIEKAEMINAINDRLFGTGNDVISKPDMIDVINLYLFG